MSDDIDIAAVRAVADKLSKFFASEVKVFDDRDVEAGARYLYVLLDALAAVEAERDQQMDIVECVRDAIAYGGHDYFTDCRPNEIYVPYDDIVRALRGSDV